MIHARLTLQGNRPNNQDRCAFLEDDGCYLMVVADGLGGHPRGEIAAQFLIDACSTVFMQCPKPIISPRLFFHQCTSRTETQIREYRIKKGLSDSPRTTATMVLLQEGMCFWAYTGDSRFYLIRQGKIVYRSLDHTLANQDTLLNGTQEGRFLTRCLGSCSPEPLATSSNPLILQPEDRLLVCTDGFWSQLPEALVIAALSQDLPLQRVLDHLGELAYSYFKGYSDNISAVAARTEAYDFAYPPLQMPEIQPDALLTSLDELDRLIDDYFIMTR